MNWHDMNEVDFINAIETNKESGLDTAEVTRRVEKYGLNKFLEKKNRTIWAMLFDQFKDTMIIILILASVLSIAVGELKDGIVIIMIVLLNAILGASQENRASNALDALKQMAAPKAKVIRGGNLTSIDSKDLVPGDLVVLDSGDYIPADLRLIESINLKIDESALTGESVSSEKDAEETSDLDAGIADRTNMAYMSTIVTYGRGRGIVVETGMTTEIGKIAGMLNETEETQTPLQKKLGSFGRLLGIICIIVSIIIIILGLIRGQDLLEVFMTAISLAVAAIPEGLPAVVTVVLATGMQRMIKRHAIMKRLSAVETLGSTTVICTDKTGTLTQNKMTVTKVYDGHDEWAVTGTGYGLNGDVSSGDKDSAQLDMLFKTAVLCNDAEIEEGDVIGDPTEGALIVLGAKANYDKEQLNQSYPRLKEYPFDSDRKLMSTLHLIEGTYYLLTKGAPDVILSRSTQMSSGGQVTEMTEADKERVLSMNQKYAKQALRVLGYGYKKVDKDAKLENEEHEMVFVGLSCMIDPPRQEAKDAVKLCKTAGIRVVMITGDHITTAQAIAKEIGIIDDESQSMEGKLINGYDDDAFGEVVKKTNVFARVSPEHKVRIVEAVKRNGDVAAMTGDGVNDAPALKKADIGIAMGIAGTDVSKQAADMILTDDNFASIVDAVEEGRVIYSNIRKFVGFLLSCNIGEILIIFTAMLVGWAVPLVPIQLLWINLITDSFPAFALGLEKGEAGIMSQKPRDPDDSLVDKKMRIAISFQSVALAVASLASYRIGFLLAPENASAEVALTIARTFCFTTLILGEMLRAYSARSEDKMLYNMTIFENKYLNYSVLISILLLLVVMYVPMLQPIFTTYGLTAIQFGIAFLLGLAPLLAAEAAKFLKA